MTQARGVSIDIRDVNLSFGRNHVLKDVSLAIKPGEFFAFLGPSGCGKTTLLRLIAGFNQSQSGHVRLEDTDISRLPPWKRDVGMVFQSYALWPHMTVARNVAFGLEERRQDRATIDRTVAEVLALVGLSELARRYPSQLSGGQQQRVALARTLAIHPKVLLLDEPLSNLDAKMREQVRREIRDLQQRLGLTTVFVTHDQEEANAICDRIAVMSQGAIQQVGSPMELYEHPRNLFVASFIGSANILKGRVVGEGGSRAFEVEGGARLPIAPTQDVPAGARLVFRPQHASLGSAGGSGLAGAVTQREFLGATVRYNVRIGASDILIDVPFSDSSALREVGSAVSVEIPLGRARFLTD
ncbi:MAG: ABC transporter ATP-binding protein [Hyphomicrobiaceae bacterium]